MKPVLTLISLTALTLTACGPPTEFTSGTLLETDRTSPDTAGSGDQIVETADNEDDLAELWESFGFQGSPPETDMEENYVLLMYTGENSCEKEIEEIQILDNSLKIDTYQEEEACDDLYNPRSFVIEIEREIAADAEDIVFEGESFPFGS